MAPAPELCLDTEPKGDQFLSLVNSICNYHLDWYPTVCRSLLCTDFQTQTLQSLDLEKSERVYKLTENCYVHHGA